MNDQVRWERCCREHGLLVTTPRRAIIRALLQQDKAVDAVAVQRAAHEQHASTNLGTVYRFLRELHALELLRAHVPARGRRRWRLAAFPAATPLSAAKGPAASLRSWRAFMRDLERIGLAEALGSDPAPAPHQRGSEHPTTLHEALQELAFQLGYRLA